MEITSSRWRMLCVLLATFAALGSSLRAELTPNSLFTDNAVLQRDTAMPVWGMATAGATVSITFDGQTAAATAGQDGKWMAHLKPHAAGGPFTMTITGDGTTLTLNNILVGDVWLASGQSNMEDPVGPIWWAQNTKNWQEEVKNANYPNIRQYHVPKVLSYHPVTDEKGTWDVCSPETASGFTAAGYYFARDLQQDIKVPIGILYSSWGGTVAEAWTSADSLKAMPDFADALTKVAASDADHYPQQLETWYKGNDLGSSAQPPWSDNAADTSEWQTMRLPTYWQDASLPGFNGICWFRKEIDLPDDYSGQTATVHLDQIDDQDTTWLNGVSLGGMNDLGLHRDYPVPAGVLKPGRNFITVRVLDLGGKGGIFGAADKMKLDFDSKAGIEPISLAGEWVYKPTTSLAKLPPLPPNPQSNPNAVTVLYDGMIAGLQPFPIKGAIWYQGESNDDTDGTHKRAKQYATLFPLMIADWRKNWGEGDFPFLFVQIAPYKLMSPNIREAQLLTLAKAPNTAMVVITDAGDDDNIHPADKQTVGERLALAARSLAYGEKIESMGPIYKSMEVQGNKAVIHFTHTDGGLMAKDGDLRGFTVCGDDKTFVTAQATIQGDTVVITADGVETPVAVRYGWSNTPDKVNLYNNEGLPASPFRTDPD